MITQKQLTDRGFVKSPRINELNPWFGDGFVCHQKEGVIVEWEGKDIAVLFDGGEDEELVILILERYENLTIERIDSLLFALYGENND